MEPKFGSEPRLGGKFLNTSKAGMLLRMNRLDSEGHLTHQDWASRLGVWAVSALRLLRSFLRTELECPVESIEKSLRVLSQDPGNVAGTAVLPSGAHSGAAGRVQQGLPGNFFRSSASYHPSLGGGHMAMCRFKAPLCRWTPWLEGCALFRPRRWLAMLSAI